MGMVIVSARVVAVDTICGRERCGMNFLGAYKGTETYLKSSNFVILKRARILNY
jgi:hypothetical protein